MLRLSNLFVLHCLLSIVFLRSIISYSLTSSLFSPLLRNEIISKSLKATSSDVSNFGMSNSNEDSGDDITLGMVRRKNGITKRVDNRDSLPYAVFNLVNEKTKTNIGTYRLDSTTSCGDILDLGSAGVFSVKKVRYLYKFTKGGFRVCSKKLDVISTTAPWHEDASSDQSKDLYLQ